MSHIEFESKLIVKALKSWYQGVDIGSSLEDQNIWAGSKDYNIITSIISNLCELMYMLTAADSDNMMKENNS